MDTKLNILDKGFILFYGIINKKIKEKELNVGTIWGFISFFLYLSIWIILHGIFKIKIVKSIPVYLIPVAILVSVALLFNNYIKKNNRYIYLVEVYNNQTNEIKNRKKVIAILLLVFSILFGSIIAPTIAFYLDHR